MSLTIIGVAISVGWAFTVPLFENPDEPTHFDYAYSIYGAGRLILAREATTDVNGGYISPDVAYLKRMSANDLIAFNPAAHVERDYGTPAYFSRIELGAPAPDFAYYARPLPHIPTYLAIYPFAYYALAALAMAGVTTFHPGVLSAFFAARLFSIVLFGATLIVAGALMRAIRLDGVAAVLALCALALMPLCSFVSASIQPDVLEGLALTGTALCLYRYQQAPRLVRMAPVAACLVVALLTKVNYAIAPVLATGCALFVVWPRVSKRRFLGHVALAIIPAAAALYVDRQVQWQPAGFPSLLGAGSSFAYFFSTAAFDATKAGGLGPLAAYVSSQLAAGFRYFFLDGPGATTYWGVFGWVDTPIHYTHVRVGTVVSGSTIVYDYLIALCSLLSVATVIVIAGRNARRSLLDKMRVVLRDPLLNIVFAHFALMLAIFVYWSNFGGQGRYLYPVVVMSVITAVRFSPRFLPRPSLRTVVGRAIAVWLCLYALIASQAAAGTIRARYYPPEVSSLGRSVTRGASTVSMPAVPRKSISASTLRAGRTPV